MSLRLLDLVCPPCSKYNESSGRFYIYIPNVHNKQFNYHKKEPSFETLKLVQTVTFSAI